MQFVKSLNAQYAALLVELQTNATFETAKLVDKGSAAAVHIFKGYFDSLLGPEFRFEISDSTAYCGRKDIVVPEAQRLSIEEPQEVRLYSQGVTVPPLSPTPPGIGGGGGGNDDDNVWVFALIAAIGALSLSTSSLSRHSKPHHSGSLPTSPLATTSPLHH